MSRTDSLSAHRRSVRPTALAVVLARALALLDRQNPFGRDGDLVQLVEVDAVLRAVVLGIVRCPLYAVAAEEPGLAGALERLGPRVLADAFRSVAPAGGEPEAAEEIEARCTAWVHGIAVAAAARWISNQGEYDRPEEAYLAGLAHSLVERAQDGAARSALPMVRFGPRIRAAVVDTHVAPDDEETRRLRHVVAQGDALVTSLGLAARAGVPDRLPESPEASAVGEAVMLELAHAAGLVGIPALPEEGLVWALVAREREALAAPRPSLRARPADSIRLLRVSGMHEDLLGLRPLSSIQEILDRGVTAIHAGLDFDRVVLLEREHGNPGAARPRVVACRTRLAGPGPRALVEVPVPPSGGLVRAFDGGPVQISGDEDGPVLAVLGCPEFAVAQVRAGSNAVGVVLADHFVSRREVDAADAAALGLAASALGMVMENAALQGEGKTLRALADKDALTGINNRRNVLEILRREIDRARRFGKPLSMALIDVDHFKVWNDLHGHQVGDMVLQTVAQLISSCGREIDACGRYGGEEFVVVLPETSAEHAMLFAERLRLAVEAHGADLSETYAPASLSVSIGVTQLLARGDDDDRMIERADNALYAAKAHGRNRTCVEIQPGSQRRTPPPAVPRGVLGDA